MDELLCHFCFTLTASEKNNKLPICVLLASILQQKQPKSLPLSHPLSPFHLLPLFLYPLCSHLTALRSPYSSCSREVQHLKSSSVLRGTADCWFPRSPSLFITHRSPCFYTPSRSSLCPPLPGFPPASNSQSSAVPVCLYWGKSDRVRKKRGGAQLLVCQRKSRPLPIQLMTRRGFIELLLSQWACSAGKYSSGPAPALMLVLISVC